MLEILESFKVCKLWNIQLASRDFDDEIKLARKYKLPTRLSCVYNLGRVESLEQTGWKFERKVFAFENPAPGYISEIPPISSKTDFHRPTTVQWRQRLIEISFATWQREVKLLVRQLL